MQINLTKKDQRGKNCQFGRIFDVDTADLGRRCVGVVARGPRLKTRGLPCRRQRSPSYGDRKFESFFLPGVSLSAATFPGAATVARVLTAIERQGATRAAVCLCRLGAGSSFRWRRPMVRSIRYSCPRSCDLAHLPCRGKLVVSLGRIGPVGRCAVLSARFEIETACSDLILPKVFRGGLASNIMPQVTTLLS
jgi:hypothetical protein